MATRKSSGAAKKHAPSHKRAPVAAGKTDPAFAASATPSPAPRIASTPIFAEPQYMPDPSVYKVPHASDTAAYNELDLLTKLHEFNPLPFNVVNGTAEPVMKLGEAYGSAGNKVEQAITKAGQIVFHSAGDTGATQARPGLQDEYTVVDKMVADFVGEGSRSRSAVLLSPGRRGLQLRRAYLLLRPVLRCISQLSGAYYRDPRQSRWSGGSGRAGRRADGPDAGRSAALALRLLCKLLYGPGPAFKRRGGHRAHHDDAARRVLHPGGAAGAHPRNLLEHAGESRRDFVHQ